MKKVLCDKPQQRLVRQFSCQFETIENTRSPQEEISDTSISYIMILFFARKHVSDSNGIIQMNNCNACQNLNFLFCFVLKIPSSAREIGCLGFRVIRALARVSVARAQAQESGAPSDWSTHRATSAASARPRKTRPRQKPSRHRTSPSLKVCTIFKNRKRAKIFFQEESFSFHMCFILFRDLIFKDP